MVHVHAGLSARSVSGAKVTLTHRQNERTSWAVSITSEHDSSTIDPTRSLSELPTLRDDLIALGLDPTTRSRTATLNALGFDLQHSTADNLLNAHRGYQVAFHAEQAGRLVPGTFNYYAVSADGRHYLPLSERLVVASRAADRQHPAGRRGSEQRAVLEEVLPRRRDEHPRLGTLRGAAR